MANQKSNKIGGSKLAEHPEHLKSWLQGNNPGPLVVEIGPTYGCNHQCAHCAFQQYSSYQEPVSYLENSRTVKYFLDDFEALGGVEVYWAGPGEPLMNPHLAEWVHYGWEKGIDMTVSSNGVLLDENRCTSLLPYLRWIRFSINAGERESYNKIHRGHPGDFDLLAANLVRAVNYKKAYNLPVQLVIQYVVYDLNWQYLSGIVALHRRVGTDLLIFRKASLPEERDSNQPIAAILKALEEYQNDATIRIRWDTFQREADKLQWRGCWGIYTHTNMDHQGNLFACNRHFVTESVYGNISHDRFVDIWNSPVKHKLFAEIEQGHYIPICGRMCQTAYDNQYLMRLRENCECSYANSK